MPAPDLSKPIPAMLAADRLLREQRGRKPRRLRRVPRQRLPIRAERRFAAALLGSMQQARELVRELLIARLPALETLAIGRQDSGNGTRLDVGWSDELARILEQIRSRFRPVEAMLEGLATTAANDVSAHNRLELNRQIRSVLGVDILISDPELGATLSASVRENVGLIKTIPDRYFSEVEQVVLRGFRTGERAESLAPEIARRFEVSRDRARFIARDQLSKLNGDLTRNRQRALGIGGYIWRTARDERVRPGHAVLEGERFDWNAPPIVDPRTGRRAHPGHDFNCRCIAEPDLESLV